MFCWRVQLFYKWNALSLPEQFLRSTWFVFSLCRLNSCLCSSNKFWFIHVFWWSWGRVFFRTFQQSGRYWSMSGVLTGLKGASGFPHCSLLLCGRGTPSFVLLVSRQVNNHLLFRWGVESQDVVSTPLAPLSHWTKNPPTSANAWLLSIMWMATIGFRKLCANQLDFEYNLNWVLHPWYFSWDSQGCLFCVYCV